MRTGRGGRSPVVCGVDIGSTNTKVIALDPRGVVVARARRTTPRGATNLSIDAVELLTAIEDMILEVCADTYQVHAACVAGVGEDGILVDDLLAPLVPALAWFDPRRAEIHADLATRIPASTATCTADDPARTIVGWRWATDQPDVGDAAIAWIALTDYASSVWATMPFMSDTLAARTAAWNRHTRTWISDRVIPTLGSVALLPPVRRAGDVIGPMHSWRLTQAGVLAADAAVIAGGHDHPIGGWGVHAMDPGSILDSMGTAEVVVAQSPLDNVAPTVDLDVAPPIGDLEGTTVLSVEELARNIDWASTDPDVGRALTAMIAGDLTPDRFLREPVFRPGARGGRAPEYTTDAPESVRSRASAVLGALARLGEHAQHTVARTLPGTPRIYSAGGWSRSPGWIAIKTAVSTSQVTVIPEPQVTATGAALLGAKALGWNASPALALGLNSHRDNGRLQLLTGE